MKRFLCWIGIHQWTPHNKTPSLIFVPYTERCLRCRACRGFNIGGWMQEWWDESNNPNQPTFADLIMAVERKFEGETRAQTALRYIREAEQRSNSIEASKEA